MGSEARRRLAAAAAAVALTLGAGACGGADEPPLRVGVVVDCQGAYRALGDVELSGAQQPLIARGARRKGPEPSDGLERVRVAGRPVELVEGCSETGEFSTLTQVVRLLVEREHVDVVVAGGALTVDGIVLREVARRYPTVAFVAAANGPREVTLQGPPASVYRVAADFGQGVAGLATYAYRELGWRRVALVLDNWVPGWGAETAFVREFCSLGGRVTSRTALLEDRSARAARAVPADVDGVAVLTSSLSTSPAFLRTLARGDGVPARRMVLGPEITGDRELLRATAPSLAGVVGSSYAPPAGSSREPRNPLAMNYRAAVEAVLRAFERAHGELSADRGRLRAELGRLRTRLAGVPLHIDSRGQAVLSTTLVRVARHGASLVAIRTIPGVDQSIGGLVPASYVPSGAGQACHRGPRPPWAR